MKKNDYMAPSIEIIRFIEEDVLAVSTGAFNESQPGDKEIDSEEGFKARK